MPIQLNDLANSTAVVTTYSPKFFDKSKMTGTGGKSRGFLSAANNPVAILPEIDTSHGDTVCRKSTYHNGNTTITTIPLNPIHNDCWDYMHEIPLPDKSDMRKVGTTQCGQTVYFKMDIHNIIFEETFVPAGINPAKTERNRRTSYQLNVFLVKDFMQPAYLNKTTYDNTFTQMYTANPCKEIVEICNRLTNNFGIHFDMNEVNDYLSSYEIYDAVVERSRQWQEEMDKILDVFLKNIAKITVNGALPTAEKQILSTQMRYIMNYNIPLDLYKNIYKNITNSFPVDIVKEVCKQNLNLLLSDTLNDLHANKSLIQSFTPPAPTVPIPASVQALSREQKDAVVSTDPLILVQAGAGTGKSTLILGRIDYLVACGVNPKDITVLSFTNAAAENIKTKNNQVHSMTIASMIHEIYSTNFKNHELSSLDTIANSLEIYYPKTVTQTPNKMQDVVDTFSRNIRHMIKNDANSFTTMSNFIEENYSDVIAILDKIHQTSLELEIIICYLNINTLIEPASVASKYLIMDEVQDNSIFEFVYTLKYINKHKESLFIVGDCSQTLYEFRASNPRALNILENSGTFATYQLNVNYRSNQEILDFANVILNNIEANQYAKIQLRANSLATTTEQSFLDKVNFSYHRMNKITQYNDALPSMFAKELRPYLNECLKRNEQVAFLAFTRREVDTFQKILEHQFPDKKVVSLVPNRMFNSTIMSTFIRKYWGDMKFTPLTNAVNIIISEIMAKLQYICYNDQKAAPAIQQMLIKWKTEESPTINMWITQVNANQMTLSAFMDNLKENMLSYEIRNNAIKQALLSANNQQAKENQNVQSANFLLSTIHSAKGLEFDNVVVFYRNDNNMDEEKKRMYYVAFTRAMKSEYILAYDTCASPQIEVNYQTILERLHAVHPAANSPLNHVTKSNRIKI